MSPNPLVGALVVKNGSIVSEGYHKKAGTEHAEVIAIKKAGKNIQGSTMFINLEPCCHFGRTPPCTDTIIKSGIKEIYIGIQDPNPLVSGKGIARLRKNKIRVHTGILEEEARELNEFYFTFMEDKRPFIILKIAQTIDGKIADVSGNSKWITNEYARRKVHKLRNEVDAILTGIGTVQADNPQLTARLVKKTKEPFRIILDSTLRIQEKATVVKQGTIIATSKNVNSHKKKLLKAKGVTIWEFEDTKEIPLKRLLQKAYKEKIQSILVEGGRNIASSFIREHLVDKAYIFIANKILGDGIASLGNLGISELQKAITIKKSRIERFKNTILIKGYVYWNN